MAISTTYLRKGKGKMSKGVVVYKSGSHVVLVKGGQASRKDGEVVQLVSFSVTMMRPGTSENKLPQTPPKEVFVEFGKADIIGGRARLDHDTATRLSNKCLQWNLDPERVQQSVEEHLTGLIPQLIAVIPQL